MRTILALMLVLTLSACMSQQGFDRNLMRTQLGDARESKNRNINEILALRPQLVLPCKVAIYFRHGRWSEEWTSNDKNRLLQLEPELQHRHLVSELLLVNDSIVSGDDLQEIRIAAARLGADAVLVINGSASTDKYSNPLGALYFALVPMFFVPGTETDALFLASATLWDVRNEYLYLSSEGEGLANQTRPIWFAEKKPVIAEAKSKAMEALQKALMARLATLTAN